MVKEQTFKGKSFNVIKGSTHPEYSYHTFEIEENEFREKYWNIASGDVVFDVGASYGSYTLTAGAMGADVFCFEPEPTVFNDLKSNIILNRFSCNMFNVGLSDSTESLNMKDYAPHWPQQTITCEYKMNTLDNICRYFNIGQMDWLKIDVEGLEVKVVKGGLNSINYLCPNLIIECHQFMDNTIKDQIKDLLPQYKFEEVDRDPCIFLVGKVL